MQLSMSKTPKLVESIVRTITLVRRHVIEAASTIATIGISRRLDQLEEIRQLKDYVTEHLQEISDSVTALSQPCSQKSLQPTFQNVLLAVEGAKLEMDNLAQVCFSSYPRIYPNDVVEVYARLQERLTDLQEIFMRTLPEYLSTIMPIPLSEPLASQITWEQVRQNPQSAIQHAFALFEERLREKTEVGWEVYGENLINRAFGTNGCLAYGAMPAEQVGVRNLMSGVYATFRNPRMHRITSDSEDTALIIIGMVDILIQIVDGAGKR